MNSLTELIAILAGCLILVMMVVIVVNVILVSSRIGSLGIATELVQIMMIIVAFGGFAYTEVMERHIAVPIFITRLPQKWRLLFEVFSYSICLFMCVVITSQLFLYAQDMTAVRKGAFGSDFPYYPFTWFAVAGFLLLDIQYLSKLIKNIFQLKGNEK